MSKDKAYLYIFIEWSYGVLFSVLKINTWKPIFKCPYNFSSLCKENGQDWKFVLFSLNVVAYNKH